MPWSGFYFSILPTGPFPHAWPEYKPYIGRGQKCYHKRGERYCWGERGWGCIIFMLPLLSYYFCSIFMYWFFQSSVFCFFPVSINSRERNNLSFCYYAICTSLCVVVPIVMVLYNITIKSKQQQLNNTQTRHSSRDDSAQCQYIDLLKGLNKWIYLGTAYSIFSYICRHKRSQRHDTPALRIILLHVLF